MKQAALALLFLFLAATASAYEFVITGRWIACHFEPTYPGDLETIWYTNRSSFADPSLLNRVAAVAPAGGGRVMAIISGDEHIVEVGLLAEKQEPVLLFRGAPGYRGRRLVVAANGTMHVLAESAAGTGAAIITIGPDRSLVRILPIAPSTLGIDLAADQCTLFTVSGTSILRYDVCSGTTLPAFATFPPIPAFIPSSYDQNVAVLPNGDVLLQDSSRLLRYDASGTLIRTNFISVMRSIALAAEGTRLFVAMGCGMEEVQELDLATLSPLRTLQYTFLTNDMTLVPSNAWRAALGSSHHTAAVPTASTMTLACLAVALGLAAFMRMR